MVLEVISLSFECDRNGFVGFDIALTTVDDRNIAKTKGDNPSSENVDDVCALVPV
jgi:hypothetical protein